MLEKYEYVILYGIGRVSACKSMIVVLLGAPFPTSILDKESSFMENKVSRSYMLFKEPP